MREKINTVKPRLHNSPDLRLLQLNTSRKVTVLACRGKVQAFSRCLMFCAWQTDFETPASTNICKTLPISVTMFQILCSTAVVIEPLQFTYIHYIQFEVFKQLIFCYINFGYDCMGRSSRKAWLKSELEQCTSKINRDCIKSNEPIFFINMLAPVPVETFLTTRTFGQQSFVKSAARVYQNAFVNFIRPLISTAKLILCLPLKNWALHVATCHERQQHSGDVPGSRFLFNNVINAFLQQDVTYYIAVSVGLKIYHYYNLMINVRPSLTAERWRFLQKNESQCILDSRKVIFLNLFLQCFF